MMVRPAQHILGTEYSMHRSLCHVLLPTPAQWIETLAIFEEERLVRLGEDNVHTLLVSPLA